MVYTGINFKNTLVTSRTIDDIIKLTSKSDVAIAFKLTKDHLTVKGAGRQKVKLAAQLFSNTTANAIRRCSYHGLEVYNASRTADFFQLVNDWFDVLNSQLSTFKHPGKEPYGLALEHQEKVLREMNELMSSCIIPGRKGQDPFQKGILITNAALKLMLPYVEKYKMRYIITHCLNQDIIEHFFGAIRSKGGLHDHPSPKEFKYRLRKYILARNTEYLEGGLNVENDDTEWLRSTLDLTTARVHEIENKDPASTEELDTSGWTEDLTPESISKPCTEELTSDPCATEFDDLDEVYFEDIGVLQEDALEQSCKRIIHF